VELGVRQQGDIDYSISIGKLTFSYNDPVIDYVASEQAASNAELTNLAMQTFGTTSQVRLISLSGSSFGSTDQGDLIDRIVMIQVAGSASFQRAEQLSQVLVTSWTHTKVSFLTNIRDGDVKLRIVSKEPQWLLQESYTSDPSDLIQESEVYSFADDIPGIESILNQPTDGFPTEGNVPLEMELRAKNFLGKQGMTFYVASIWKSYKQSSICPVV